MECGKINIRYNNQLRLLFLADVRVYFNKSVIILRLTTQNELLLAFNFYYFL